MGERKRTWVDFAIPVVLLIAGVMGVGKALLPSTTVREALTREEEKVTVLARIKDAKCPVELSIGNASRRPTKRVTWTMQLFEAGNSHDLLEGRGAALEVTEIVEPNDTAKRCYPVPSTVRVPLSSLRVESRLDSVTLYEAGEYVPR